MLVLIPAAFLQQTSRITVREKDETGQGKQKVMSDQAEQLSLVLSERYMREGA